MCGWRVLTILYMGSEPIKRTIAKGKFTSPTVRQDYDDCKDYEFEGQRLTRFERILLHNSCFQKFSDSNH